MTHKLKEMNSLVNYLSISLTTDRIAEILQRIKSAKPSGPWVEGMILPLLEEKEVFKIIKLTKQLKRRLFWYKIRSLFHFMRKPFFILIALTLLAIFLACFKNEILKKTAHFRDLKKFDVIEETLIKKFDREYQEGFYNE